MILIVYLRMTVVNFISKNYDTEFKSRKLNSMSLKCAEQIENIFARMS